MGQAEEALRKIILPGDAAREEFLYYTVNQLHPRPFAIAMVKLPKSLGRVFEKGLEASPDAMVNWHILDQRDESTEGLETTRYQLRGYLHTPDTLEGEGIEGYDGYCEFLEGKMDDGSSLQDGYIFFPKSLRDGNHERVYVLNEIPEDHFRAKVGRGMYEEVAWSPFGSIESAVEAEAENTERNPLLRRWERV